jgi:hypothetical protein
MNSYQGLWTGEIGVPEGQPPSSPVPGVAACSVRNLDSSKEFLEMQS